MPVNYLNMNFVSDLSNTEWGYEIHVMNEYDYDLGIRLKDSEIINLPNIGYLHNLFSDSFIDSLNGHQLNRITQA